MGQMWVDAGPQEGSKETNTRSLYCSGGQKRKMNNYNTWWVAWTVTGRAWLTIRPCAPAATTSVQELGM